MKKLIAIAALVMFPMVASAKGTPGWTPLGKNDKMVRQLIADQLNTRNVGHYTMSNVKGERKAIGTPTIYGSQSQVKFTAVPRIKIDVNGKKTWVKMGGVTGECKFGSIMCQPPSVSGLKITSLLR